MNRCLILLVVFAAALLASCSTVRLSYDHSEWLLGYMAGQYVDLNKQQWRTFKTELAQFHVWHREHELPRYADAFDEAARRVQRGMSRADVEWAIGIVRARARVLGQQAAEDFAPVVDTLSDAQLREMEQRFAKDNGKFVKTQLSGDAQTLAARRTAWLQGRLEDFVGSLTPQQRARVQALSRQFPEIPRLRLEERRRRQAVFLHIVREYRGTPQLLPNLRAFLVEPERGRSESSREAMERWEHAFVDMLVDIERTLTPEQRAAAVKRFKAYADDFRALTGEQAAALPSPVSPAIAGSR